MGEQQIVTHCHKLRNAKKPAETPGSNGWQITFFRRLILLYATFPFRYQDIAFSPVTLPTGSYTFPSPSSAAEGRPFDHIAVKG
jgi:hypothetical protein